MASLMSLGISRLLALAGRWRVSTRGVAAVEFALILPILITLFYGLSELTLAFNVDRKLTLLSRSLADLTTRTDKVSSTELDTYFKAASAIMRPYDSSRTQMVVTSVLVTKAGTVYVGNVAWSCGRNITAKQSSETQSSYDANNLKVRALASLYTVPEGFRTTATRSFILVETLRPFDPVFGKYITGTIRMRETIPWPIRNTDTVDGPSTCPA